MSISEKLYGGLGWIVGSGARVGFVAGGAIAAAVTSDPVTAKRRQQSWSDAGKSVHGGATKVGKACGRTLAVAAEISGKVVSGTAAAIAEGAGASEKTVSAVRAAGNIGGAMVPGFLAADLLITGVVDVLGSGLGAFHGAAQVAHGEKLLGTVIGGGQAAGKTLCAASDTAAAMASAVDGVGRAATKRNG